MACWAHARRKLYDVHQNTASPLAREALERIAELFAIEQRINGSTPPQRLEVRQEEAVPLLAALEAFLRGALDRGGWIWKATATRSAVGVAIAALWLHRRRNRRTLRLVGGAIARPPRIDMTGERALERLLAIERSGVLDRDAERKAGYADMVGVIREYLAARYRIAIHDRTSSELLGELGRVAAPDEVELVASWLDGCDLVKYGGWRATPADAGKALDDARALIVTTTATAGPRAVRPSPVAEAA